MKRVVALTVAVGLVAAVSAAGTQVFAASASSSTTAGGKSVTIHLVEKQVGFNYIDNPPRQGPNAPPLIGDEFAFTSVLTTTSGARAGSLEATCIVSRGGVNATGPCYGIFALKGGQIAAMALVNFNGNTTHIAIVGGTGVYEGVTGSVVSVSRSSESPISDDTLHLIWPA